MEERKDLKEELRVHVLVGVPYGLQDREHDMQTEKNFMSYLSTVMYNYCLVYINRFSVGHLI